MIRPAYILLLALLACSASLAAASSDSIPHTDTLPRTAATAEADKGAAFFFRLAEKVDEFLLNGLDTNYISLPEYRWSTSLKVGGTGVNATYTTWIDPLTSVALHAKTMPSLDLGFDVGYRGYGGGYSWDLLNAYTSNWNLSFGSVFIGIEFLRTISTNLTGKFVTGGKPDPSIPLLDKGDIRMANTSLNAWYALNAAHYSHNAAIKQGYIQKRTAGSLLLSVGYMSTEMSILDTAKYVRDPELSMLFDGVKGMITRQVALGLGYGINYTPNRGKLLLHAAANMQIVCYTVNHVSYVPPEDVYLPGEPQYLLRSASPVHVAGTMRAAVSWQINRWVTMAAWAQANNLGFSSQSGNQAKLDISNWHWQAHLNIGVHFGASKKRIRQVLGDPEQPAEPLPPRKPSKLPLWVREYFFAPMERN